jgi:ubiquinone/menaquinone biosynthesis C-methylase UbiE
VVKPSTKDQASGLVVHFRYWIAKLFYRITFLLLVRDVSWQEDIFQVLAPKAGDRILDFGPGSSTTVLSLALRHPETTFIAADSNFKAVENARRKVARKKLTNISFRVVALDGKLPFGAGSFDQAVCMLVLHDRPPEEKLQVVREIVRVVRRGGALHVADFDKPENSREGRILEFARRISGPAAAAPHIDGSWIECLAKGGLIGVRRQSSCSIGIGRISVVRARKR